MSNDMERVIREFRDTVMCHHDERVRNLMADTEIDMNFRLTVTAGRAFHPSRRMELSVPVLRSPVNTEQDIWDTLAHEFAHLCEFAFGGHSLATLRKRGDAAAHNDTWRAWALEFGDSTGDRFHDLFIPKDCGKFAERSAPTRHWIMRGGSVAERKSRKMRVNAWREANGNTPLV